MKHMYANNTTKIHHTELSLQLHKTRSWQTNMLDLKIKKTAENIFIIEPTFKENIKTGLLNYI